MTYLLTLPNPANGTFVQSGSTVTFTPAAGFTGEVTFDFVANDGANDSNTATVTITVAPNLAPVAEDQTVQVAQGQPITITLGATDAENDPLTYSIVTGPSNGVLDTTNLSSSSVTYTSAAGFTGAVTFTFVANDGTSDSNIATVTIDVIEANFWVDTVGVDVSVDNTLTKTSANGWDNSGAISGQSITGDGGIEVTVNQLGTHRMIGLSPSSADNNYTSIIYGLYLSASNRLEVYESGRRKQTSGDSLAVGDRVSVERIGSTVFYKHNDVIFYTSDLASENESLFVDVSLYSSGATLSNPLISGGS